MHTEIIFADVLHQGYFDQKMHVWVSDKGINEWESPDGKICEFWEFFVCLTFVKHKSNNGKSKRQKRKTGNHLILIRRILKFSFFLKYASISKQESYSEGVNWKSKCTKYDQIKSKFCEPYPEVEDDKFPCSNDLDPITKDELN